MKYDILKSIVNGVVFEQKNLRESFMQEILLASDNTMYKNGLQRYLKRNAINVIEIPKVEWHPENPDDVEPKPKPQPFMRILELTDSDLNVINMEDKGATGGGRNQFVRRLFLVTNEGFLIMRNVSVD